MTIESVDGGGCGGRLEEGMKVEVKKIGVMNKETMMMKIGKKKQL